ncbi:MAG: hypothetical protein IT463_03175 [Planctomycetes bacterium]|nr:hypothetical protein [Planctomycetota bacterium]
MIRKTAGLAFLLALIAAGSVPCVVQDAGERKIRLHLAGLDAVYAHPMADTADRIAAVPGVRSATAVSNEGSLLRLDVVTTLDDRLLAEALGMVHVSTVEGRVLLAPVLDAGARRAEARVAMLAILDALEKIPQARLFSGDSESGPDRYFDNSGTYRVVRRRPGNVAYSNGLPANGGSSVAEVPGSMLSGSMEKKLAAIGLSAAILKGVHYKETDYTLISEGDGIRMWAGTPDWVGVAGPQVSTDWDESAEWDPDSALTDTRFVGVYYHVQANERMRSWQDNDNVGPPGENSGRRNKVRDGKLVLAEGTSILTKVLSRAAGYHLDNKTQPIADRPHGSGWQCLEDLQYNTDDEYSWRYYGRAEYSAYNVSLRWNKRDADSHILAQARFYFPGHALYLEAEVDASSLQADHEAQGTAHAKGASPDVGGHLRWVFGAEQTTEEFSLRYAEMKANFTALLAALNKEAAKRPLAELCGPLTEELHKALGAPGTFNCLAPTHYTLRQQAFGDVLFEAGNPSTGGRLWMLGNVARNEKLRGAP